MADIFYDATGDFSALTPYKIVASELTVDTGNGDVTALDITRYQAFTASEAGDCTGIVVPISISNKSAVSTVTATLQEDSGGWVDRASKAIIYNDIIGTHEAEMNSTAMAWTFFEFAAPYTITTAAATWRIKMEASTASGRWCQAASEHCYAIPLDTVGSYSSGDNIVQAQNVILTIDQSITAPEWVQGTNSEIAWENPPAASYTLTITELYPSNNSAFRCGSSANPIPYAEKATVNISTRWNTGFEWNGNWGGEIEIYGAHTDDYYATVNVEAATGQADIVTTEDRSAVWSAGDAIRIWCESGVQTKTIDSISGTTITLTANLTPKVGKGWKILNVTRADETFGVEWIGYLGTGSGTGVNGANNTVGKCDIDGIFSDTTSFIFYLDSYGSRNAPSFSSAVDINHIVAASPSVTYALDFNGVGNPEVFYGSTFSYLWKNTNSSNLNISSNNSTLSHINSGVYVTTSSFSGHNNTYSYINACITWSGSTRVVMSHKGGGNTWTDCKFGYGGNALSLSGVYNTTFTDCTVDNSDNVAVYLNTAIGVEFVDCEFGQSTASVTASIGMSLGFNQALFRNCLFDATLVDTSVPDSASGSYAKTHDVDQTADDHRSWWKYGKMQSCRAGLADSTVHTAGGIAIRLEPTDESDTLDWNIIVPTGDIQNSEMMIGVWVKLNSATFYAGTHEMPRLTIDYDNGTTGYAEAAANTDWQYIYLAFTPTTAYPQVTVTLSGATNAIGSDAYIYWDDMSILYPAGHTLNLGAMDLWADALPVVPPLATALVAADVWAIATSILTGAGSIGKYLVDGVVVADKTGYKLASDGLDIISTVAPSGVAANFREMIVQSWRKLFKKSVLTATELKTYADDDSTVVTTQTVADDGTTQTLGSSS